MFKYAKSICERRQNSPYHSRQKSGILTLSEQRPTHHQIELLISRLSEKSLSDSQTLEIQAQDLLSFQSLYPWADADKTHNSIIGQITKTFITGTCLYFSPRTQKKSGNNIHFQNEQKVKRRQNSLET